jgi:hypothetical protein
MMCFGPEIAALMAALGAGGEVAAASTIPAIAGEAALGAGAAGLGAAGLGEIGAGAALAPELGASSIAGLELAPEMSGVGAGGMGADLSLAPEMNGVGLNPSLLDKLQGMAGKLTLTDALRANAMLNNLSPHEQPMPHAAGRPQQGPAAHFGPVGGLLDPERRRRMLASSYLTGF